MSLKALCRAALAAAALLALGGGAVQAQVAYTANTIQSLAYRSSRRTAASTSSTTPSSADAFEKSGEMGIGHHPRSGIGPNGETVVRRQRDGPRAVLLQARHLGRGASGRRAAVQRSSGATARRASPSATTSTWRCPTASSRASPTRCPTTRSSSRAPRPRATARAASASAAPSSSSRAGSTSPSSSSRSSSTGTDVDQRAAQPVRRGREHRLGHLEEEEVPREVRPVQGAVRPPAAHLVGRPAVRRPRHPGRALQRRPRDRPRAVGRRWRQQARLARDDVERQRPHARPRTTTTSSSGRGRVMWQAIGNARMNQWGSGALLTEGDLGDSRGTARSSPSPGNFSNNNRFASTTGVDLDNTDLGGRLHLQVQGLRERRRVRRPPLEVRGARDGHRGAGLPRQGLPGPGVVRLQGARDPGRVVLGARLPLRQGGPERPRARQRPRRRSAARSTTTTTSTPSRCRPTIRQLKDDAANSGAGTTTKEFRLQTQFIF